MNKELLKINHLAKRYHDKQGEIEAIQNITLSIKEKEFVAIVGPSGCGKSTLLSILTGLEEKLDGTITSNHSNLSFGYMLQKDSLFPWLTILDNCLIGLKVQGNLTDEKRKEVIQLLKKYGLEEFKDKYPKSLSGGMRQRVALIRTLATNPDILLLDEPFSSLDYISRLKLSDDIYQIIKEEGKTAIIVTHDIQEAIALADRVIVLTKRPATIKKEYKIHLTDKSTPFQNRKCKEFNDYYDAIWRDLNEA